MDSLKLLLLLSDLAAMSLLDHEEGSNQEGGGGPNCDPPAFPYQYPIPHPYSSPHLLHQLPACEAGGERSHHSGGKGYVSFFFFTVVSVFVWLVFFINCNQSEEGEDEWHLHWSFTVKGHMRPLKHFVCHTEFKRKD